MTSAGDQVRPDFGTPFDLVSGARLSWPGYYGALVRADAWWRERTEGAFGVLTSTSSWLETMRAASTIMLSDWSRLTYSEYQILMGMKVDNKFDYGLLGSMGGAGYAKNIFLKATTENLQYRRVFQSCLRRIMAAKVNVSFPKEAEECAAELISLRWIAMPIASRFLALARPDVLLSVNGASKKGLSQLSKISQNAIYTAGGYRRLIEWLMSQFWWESA